MGAQPYPWQQAIWQNVIARIHANNLPHALLLRGPQGLGKNHFSHCLSQSLLCFTSNDDFIACGDCSACRQVTAGSHADLKVVKSALNSNTIQIDQIRELGDFYAQKSQGLGLKIAILEHAESMTANAANSLLKTLEEPPPGGLLLLTSAWPMLLPATIRSRCQTLLFRVPQKSTVLPWLQAELGSDYDEEQLEQAWCRAFGSPLLARQFCSPEFQSSRRLWWQLFQQLCHGKISVVRAAEQWQDENDPMLVSVNCLLSWYNDLIKLKLVPASEHLTNLDLRDELGKLAAMVSIESLYQQLDQLQKIYQLKSTQINKQLLFEELFLLVADFHTTGE